LNNHSLHLEKNCAIHTVIHHAAIGCSGIEINQDKAHFLITAEFSYFWISKQIYLINRSLP